MPRRSPTNTKPKTTDEKVRKPSHGKIKKPKPKPYGGSIATRTRLRRGGETTTNTRTRKLSIRSKEMISTPNEKQEAKDQRITLNPGEVSGRHAVVRFGDRVGTAKKVKPVAVKKQVILSPKNINDRSYRELKILQVLDSLKGNSKYFLSESGFIGVIDWYKMSDNRLFMHYVLEKADMTLFDIGEVTFYEFKCLLFQVLFALFVGQKEFEFVHNDLHLKNILLKRPSTPNHCNGFKDRSLTWYTTGYTVKITDFGLSRIKLKDGRIIYDHNQTFSETFEYMRDVDQIFTEITRNLSIIPESFATEEEIEDYIEERSHKKRVPTKQEALEEITKIKKRDISNLKTQLRKLLPLRNLIRHKLFDELKEMPEKTSLAPKVPQTPIPDALDSDLKRSAAQDSPFKQYTKTK